MELPRNPTNAELLDVSANIGLSAMEYILKLNSAGQKSELTSHIRSVNKGLVLLNKEWESEIAELVQDNLSILKEDSESPKYSETIKSTLLTRWEYGQAEYKLLEAREQKIIDANNEITKIHDNWGVLKPSEQSEAFPELLDKVGQNKTRIITNANDKAVDRVSDDLKELQNILDAANMAKGLDIKKKMDGLQVDLTDMNAGYFKQMARDLGFVEGETVEKISTFQLPKDAYITESGYADALETLNKYENAVLSSELKLREQAEIAEDMEVFQVMNEWAHAPSSSTQSHKFQAITDLVFMDDPGEMLQAPYANMGQSPSTLFLSEADLQDAQGKAKQILDLKATGKYPQAIAALQNLDLTTKKGYAEIKANILEQGIEAQEDKAELLTSNIASNILISTGNLNKHMTTWNSNNFDADEWKLPTITVYSDIDKIKGTVDLNKKLHADVLDRMVDKAEDWGWRNDLQDREPYLDDFDKAETYLQKFQAISQLRNKYLGADGQDKGLAKDTWKNEQTGKLFIALLQSFDWLFAADPTGQVTAKTFGD